MASPPEDLPPSLQPAGPPKDEEENDNPIEQVRLTVPITDDPTQPVLTFRTWVLGLSACVILSFLNQFFSYRANQITVSAVCAQIAVLPLGRLMAATLPSSLIRVPFTNWSFSLNPGPFNLKEHVLITIFANSGAGTVYAISIINIVKAFYHRDIHPLAAFLLSLNTQMLGYGWAGIFRSYLVDSPYMWWPNNLVQVSLFSTLHKKEKRAKGGLSRLQFFLMALTASFAYYIIPNYFFPSIMFLSFICWIWKDSVFMQQIGSGRNGLGIGSFGLDWSTVCGFLGSPLAYPWFAIANTMVGFILYLYVLVPIGYWTNSFNAKQFPILSSKVFDSTGKTYNTSRIIDSNTFTFDHEGYEKYSKLHLSIVFAYAYGLGFATLTATLSHVALFHGRSIWRLWRNAREDRHMDVHARIMKKNYAEVPQWWFLVIMAIVMALSLWVCEGFGKQLQLPYWGLFLACALAFVYTLPIGVIQATTNLQPGLNIITEMIIGYIYPGRPLANVTFKTYGYISMAQALTFLEDFKLGHYMKIPPKSMFLVQMVGTVVASMAYFATAWWLLTSIQDICEPDKLPAGSPWTCPYDAVFYSASIIWGVVGPLRMFGPLGIYSKLNYFFLIGLLAPLPIWILSRMYPEKKWIKLINMPLILGATSYLPPAGAVNYIMWGLAGFIFNYKIYRRHKDWWARHTYVLSAGLDAGLAFMAVLCFFALQMNNINGISWWGVDADDHCSLAHCPTAPGVKVPGCPVH